MAISVLAVASPVSASVPAPALTVAGDPGGTAGADGSHLSYPYGVAIDSHRNLFVADTNNSRVQEFRFDGYSYGSPATTVAGDPGGSFGSDATHLYYPYGLALDASGNLFVADTENHRVQEFVFNGSAYSSSGFTVAGISSVHGTDSAHLNRPFGVAVDANRNLFIADSNNSRVQEYLYNGSGYPLGGTTVAGVTGLYGTDNTHLAYPYGVGIDAMGNLFVADAANHRIQEYPVTGSTFATTATTVAGVPNVRGSDATHLNDPFQLAFDGNNNLYIADFLNHRIQEYTRSGPAFAGTAVTVGGVSATPGSDANHLDYAAGVAVDTNGNIFAADTFNQRVQEFGLLIPHTPGFNEMRAAGSEGSYYLLSRISDLYTQSSLFGCTLSVDNRTCDTSLDDSSTDVADNYSRNEFVNGLTNGSALGVSQLCGASGTGGAPSPDFARVVGAAPAGSCTSALTYARDSVVGDMFPFNNTAAISCASCTATQVGPVAGGWRPGDPFGGPYSGQPFLDLSNQGSSGPAGSVAERIFCETGANRITDWGQLTDASPDPANPGHTRGSDGNGAPIGAPIYVPNVTPSGGTYATWAAFVGCANPSVNNADGKILQDSNAAQLAAAATADHPTDTIAAANQLAETVYYMSYGVSVWKPYTTLHGRRMSLNGINPSQRVESPSCTPAASCTPIPTVRALSNAYDPGHLRGSVGALLNWICDTDPANINHGIDQTTGRTYSDELSNTIGTVFFFPRVPCATDAHGNSILPLTAHQVTDLNS